MQNQGVDFSDFAWGFVDHRPISGDGIALPARTERSEALSAALKKRGFKFAGPVIVYAWMQAVGMVNDHALHCFRRENPTP
jgi:DNA-3-methyladenine glycosylase I